MRVNSWVVEIAVPDFNAPTNERTGPIRFDIAIENCSIINHIWWAGK